MDAVSITSSGRKLIAAVPPAANCALATRLMVTKLVKDCANGVCDFTSRTDCAICARNSCNEVLSSCAVLVPRGAQSLCCMLCVALLVRAVSASLQQSQQCICESSLISLLPTMVLTNRFQGSGRSHSQPVAGFPCITVQRYGSRWTCASPAHRPRIARVGRATWRRGCGSRSGNRGIGRMSPFDRRHAECYC